MAELLTLLAQIDTFSENNYYNRRIIYERIPNYKDFLLSNGSVDFYKWKNSKRLTFDLTDTKNIASLNLSPFQRENAYILRNINQHLDNITEKEIINATSLSNTYSTYYAETTRRSWDKTYYNGFLNTEKSLIEAILGILKEIQNIFKGSDNIDIKLQSLIKIFDNENFKILLIYFKDVIIEINIIIENIKANYHILKSDYKQSNKIFLTVSKLLMRVFFKRNYVKELYNEGKKGNWQSAIEYVKFTLNNKLIEELIKNNQSKNPILTPIISPPKFLNQETNVDLFFEKENNFEGINLIPLAYAFSIKSITKWEIDTEINNNPIIKTNHHISSRRESKNAWERFGKPSHFEGKVFANRHYIVIDDNITLGSSVRDLQEYIEINGGYVLSILSLNRSLKSLYDNRLRPKKEDLEIAKEKFKKQNYYFKNILGYENGIECLTKQELNVLQNDKNFKYNCLKILNDNYFVLDKYIDLMQNKIIPKILRFINSK